MSADGKATGMAAPVRRSITHTMTTGQFAGRTFELMALSIKDLVQCQEESLEDEKRAYLQTYTRNADLMPAEFRKDMIRDAFEAAASMHYEGLPKKITNMPLLDEAGKMKIDESGTPVTQPMRVEHAMWWVGETLKGQMYSVWLGMRKCNGQREIAFDDVDELFSHAMIDLQEMVRKLGQLSNPRVLGNAEAPAAAGPPAQETARQRRARLRTERAKENLLTGR